MARTLTLAAIQASYGEDLAVNIEKTRGLIREAAALGALVAALARARTVSDEPVGLLSHHLAMDGGAWDFLRSLWEKALTMPGICLRPARNLFAAKSAVGGEKRG